MQQVPVSPFRIKDLFLQLLGVLPAGGLSSPPPLGMSSGKEHHLACGHAPPPVIDACVSCMFHCHVPWSLPQSSISPSAQSCWFPFPVTGAVPRTLPKLSPPACSLPQRVLLPEKLSLQCAFRAAHLLLAECHSAKSLEQVVTHCSLVARKSCLFCPSLDFPRCWWGLVAKSPQ